MSIKKTFFGNRKKYGISFGIIATFFMTLIMLTGMATGQSPIPQPIPAAIAETIMGPLPKPVLMISGMIAHFAYGAVAGLLFFTVGKESHEIWQGLGWGFLLWLIMQVVFLPLIGWGFFAGAVDPKVIPATLILHLVYGGILGYGFLRFHRQPSQ